MLQMDPGEERSSADHQHPCNSVVPSILQSDDDKVKSSSSCHLSLECMCRLLLV